MLTMYQDNALTGPAHLAWPRTYTGPHTTSQGTVSSLQSHVCCNVILRDDMAMRQIVNRLALTVNRAVHGCAIPELWANHQASDQIRVDLRICATKQHLAREIKLKVHRQTIQDAKMFQRMYPNHK